MTLIVCIPFLHCQLCSVTAHAFMCSVWLVACSMFYCTPSFFILLIFALNVPLKVYIDVPFLLLFQTREKVSITCRRHPTKCCKVMVSITRWAAQNVLALMTKLWQIRRPSPLKSHTCKKRRVSPVYLPFITFMRKAQSLYHLGCCFVSVKII